MEYVYAAERAALKENEPLPLALGGAQVALYLVEDAVYATSNVCTHQKVLLSDGFMEDGCIECPLHEGKFDVRTGAVLCSPPTEPLRTYPVRVEDGKVLVGLG